MINNLVHPRVVEAFLVSPTFTSKLPKGVQLFLRPHFPVHPRADSSAEALAALQGEKYTWAIVDERAGTHTKYVLAAALVEPDVSDEDFDALDAALTPPPPTTKEEGKEGEEGKEEHGFRMYLDDANDPCFIVGTRKVTPSDDGHAFFTWVLNGAAVSRAAGLKLILSNGPRWILVETDNGLSISRSVGKRKDGTMLDKDGANTSMFGGLVSQAFEAVVTRDAMASLMAAKAKAGK